jgi:DNA polymerase I-like protein with 3'-5' exonuclease and polymerase domains
MIVTTETLDYSIARIEAETHLGLDTETTGLGADDRIFSLIIAVENESFYFNFQEYGDGSCPANCVLKRSDVYSRLGGVFRDPRRIWYIQNAKFDLRMLAADGVGLEGTIHCTYAVERILKNNLFGADAYRLSGLAKRRGWEKDEAVDQFIKKHKLITKVKMPGKKKEYERYHFDRVPFTIVAPYGEKDGHLHRSIGLAQISEFNALNEDSRYPSMRNVLTNEIRLTKTCYRMEHRGIKIDKPLTAKALEYELSQIHKAEKEFISLTGESFIDSNKPLALVFDKLGCAYPKTDKGNPSFAADVLESMKNPVADIVNKIRYHDKRAGTYYSSFLFFADRSDIIHPDTRQAGTETGRFSYRDPNLQNLSKEDEAEDQTIPFHIRECFVPRQNHFFYSIDYQQMEYRMMLDYAGEHRIIKQVLEGADIHQAIADQVGILRKHAKTLNFAILYGAGLEKIAHMLGITVREARELRLTYFGGLPRVERFIYDVRKAGEARGFVFNWYGRRCNIAQRDWAYVLPNHLIQGGCADVVKVAMNRIDDMLIDKKSPTHMLLQVHDELLIEPPFGDERIIEAVRDIMENVYEAKNGMRLTTSIEHSLKSWGYRHKIKGTPYEQKELTA